MIIEEKTRRIQDVLEKLKLKAAAKIREFLLAKINAFKKPMANYQMPQNAMLKTRFFFEFLLAHQRDVAKEIQDEYVDVLSKIYFSYFKTYLSRLSKLQVVRGRSVTELYLLAVGGGVPAILCSPHLVFRALLYILVSCFAKF